MKILQIVTLFVLATVAVQSKHVPDPKLSNFMGEGFAVITDNVTAIEARSACESLKGQYPGKYHLYIPVTLAENKKMYEMMKTANKGNFWIGVFGDADPKNRNWKSSRGVLLKESNMFWGPREPNNFKHHDERCVEMRAIKKNDAAKNWNDTPCTHKNGFVCMKLEMRK